MDIAGLIKTAQQTSKNAYAPYSGLHVGAALLTSDDNVFPGCNIENASYGLTLCAERAAVANAVTAGHIRFKAIAVISDGEGYCRPCGVCRQVLREFGEDILVIMAAKDGSYEARSIAELLPDSFNL